MVEEIVCDNGIKIIPYGEQGWELEFKDFYPHSGFGHQRSITRVNIKPGTHSGYGNSALYGVDSGSVGAIGAKIKAVASDALRALKERNTDVNDAYIRVCKKLEGPPTPSPITKEEAEKYRLTDETLIESGVMMSSTRASDVALSSELNELIHETLGINNYGLVEVDYVPVFHGIDTQFRMNNVDMEKGAFYLGEWTRVK